MQINSIRAKTGMGDKYANKNEEQSTLCAGQLVNWIHIPT